MSALRKAGVWLGLVEEDDDRRDDGVFDDEFNEDDDEFAPTARPRSLTRPAPRVTDRDRDRRDRERDHDRDLRSADREQRIADQRAAERGTRTDPDRSLRMSEAELPVQRYGDFANTVAIYVDEVKKLADHKRDEQVAQAKLFATNAFKLSDDPTLSSGLPTALKVVPYFNFAPIENAVVRLKASAKTYDAALAAKKVPGGTAPECVRAAIADLEGRLNKKATKTGAKP